MGNRLYVGNLSYDATEDSLRTCFAECGEVSEVRIITDRETGRSRGFAFVTMKTDTEAQSALGQLNGAVVDGRPLRVNEAEERGRSGGGGGGYGGGGGGGGGGYGGGDGNRNERGGHRGW
jgi:RNA recognition motif-containing protein